jgi:hypothetical protein
MHDAVHRQRELRMRLLNAAYAAFIQDPDGFVDVTSLSFDAASEAKDPPPAVRFAANPPTLLELRAATYYLLERGLVVLMGADGLLRNSSKAEDLFIHVTANGVDAFEGFVLSNESRASTRPVGFSITPSQTGSARPVPVALGPEDGRLE